MSCYSVETVADLTPTFLIPSADIFGEAQLHLLTESALTKLSLSYIALVPAL